MTRDRCATVLDEECSAVSTGPSPEVTLRAVAAVLDVLDEHDRGGLDIVARVALLVGEVRARREAWLQAMQLYWELRRATDGAEAAGSSAPG